MQQVHMYLFYLTVACVVSILAEMFQPKNVMPALCRIFFTFLQGTWFYQIGFILYPPSGDKWDEEDHTQVNTDNNCPALCNLFSHRITHISPFLYLLLSLCHRFIIIILSLIEVHVLKII